MVVAFEVWLKSPQTKTKSGGGGEAQRLYMGHAFNPSSTPSTIQSSEYQQALKASRHYCIGSDHWLPFVGARAAVHIQVLVLNSKPGELTSEHHLEATSPK